MNRSDRINSDPVIEMTTQQPGDDRPLVLVADDNADMRQHIVRLLNPHYRTKDVPDGKAALASALSCTPDLILIDELLPRLDGVALLQALRADPRTSHVPVIMLSERAGEESQAENVQEGADDYLVKPFSAKELLARVAVHLKMGRMRREASEALRTSDHHHRSLFEQTVDGIFLADASGRYVDVNTAGCEMLGYSREEVLARTHLDMIEPDEWPRVGPEIARFADGHVVRSEWRFRRKDRSVFVGEISGRSMPGGRVQGILRDISERQAAEAAIRASEGQVRSILESITDGFFSLDRDWRITYINTAGERFLGRTPGDLIGKVLWDEFPGTVGSEFERVYRRVVAGRMRESFTAHYPDLNSWYEVTAYPAPQGLSVYFRDITDQKQAGELLRASEARRRLALDAAELGMWHVDPVTRATTTDARYRAIFGTTEEWTDYLQAVAVIHPDDQPAVLEAVAAATRLEDPAPYAIEYRIVHLDGSIHWVLANGRPSFEGVGGARRVASFDGTVADITERKRSEVALKASESRSRIILESITDGFCALDADWRFTYINAAGERIMERAPGELIGKRVWEEYPGAVGSEFEQVYRRVASGQGSESITAHYPDLDRWYEVTAYPAAEGMSVYFRDVTEQKHSEERLRASEVRWQLALDGAELGMWHTVPATNDILTDARVRAIFGTTDACPDLAQLLAIIHPDDLPGVQASIVAATRLEDPVPSVIEYRVVHPDGTLRWVSGKGRSSIVGTGSTRRVASFDGTVADITDRKRSEEEREQLVARLQEQDVRKNEFLAILAHELRNPLAPIRNGLQLMKLASNNREAVEQARAMMERQVGHMVRLIDDLLDLSRISQGTLELKRERIELAVVVRNALETSQPLIDQMGHALSLDVPPVPIYLDGDMSRLTQVISNLLNNAAKYTERGGRIRLCAEQVGSEIVVTVEDNGVGIPAHMLSRVFEMFTQVDRSWEMSKGGLGIGLSLVQRLVELHGGSVLAHSEGKDQGSAFVVRLPVVLLLDADRKEDGEVQPVRSAPRHRILVVDDNQDAAISLAQLLTIMGNETQTAYDGFEALAVAAAFRPDVTLLDIGMPKMNGYEVCRRIRQQAWGKNMVVCALTGWGQEEDQQRSLAAGFDAHLVKPVLADDLEALLSGLTGAKG